MQVCIFLSDMIFNRVLASSLYLEPYLNTVLDLYKITWKLLSIWWYFSIFSIYEQE